MDISSILSGGNAHEVQDSGVTRRTQNWQSSFGSNGGEDTIRISGEAMEKYLAMRESAQKQEVPENGFLSGSETSTASTTAGRSGEKLGVNLYSMMLESLFLAELEESESIAKNAEDGMPEKQKSLLGDSGKVADLKKLMQDVMNGKADITDLPQVMASRSGGSGSGGNSVASPKKNGSESEPKTS